MEILNHYLSAIAHIQPEDKEHTFRTALENFFNALKAKLNIANTTIYHEPKNDQSGLGAPDFLVIKSGLVLGYIENKRVDCDLNALIVEANKNEKAQIARYLKLSPNLILTDYLRFFRIYKNEKNKIEIIKKFEICSLYELKSLIKNKKRCAEKEKECLEFFELFFNENLKPISTALDFANALALRTQELNKIFLEEKESQKIKGIYEDFKRVLYKDLDFEDFCDSFAQTLTYALFLAKLNSNEKEVDLYNLTKYISRSFSLIREISIFLQTLDDLKSAKWLIDEILNIINHIDMAGIVQELNQVASKDETTCLHKDPYLHFYETFLSRYSPRMREIRGVYYTPYPVVCFIINAIDFVLKKEFNEKKGLSAALENELITLLDFATGTGAFLLEAFRKALENVPQNSLRYQPKKLIERFKGFEYLIAPYTIAHLKIAQSFKEEFGAPLEDEERLNIFLTNTLYNPSIADQTQKEADIFVGALTELSREFRLSSQLKNERILIITGNPPYSGASANKGIFEYEVKSAYGLEPASYEKLKNEKNPKWLLDDYVKFIRFAELKIEGQKKGIFAFISNHGFIDNPTFRGMRYHLLNTFDKIYILDLHGNVKKKEKSPDGSKDDNVFDIQQGVCISVFVKTGQKKQDLAQVYHYDLYGKRKDKYDFLQSNGLDSIAWSVIVPKAPFYLFIPQNESLHAKYDKGISIKDIFIKSGVGICSKRDNIVFQDSREKLKELLLDFATKPSEELRKKYDIGEDSGGWKLEWAINEVKKYKDNLDDFITQCHYRPFDLKWTFYTNQNCGFMARPVYDIFKHFLGIENVALCVSRQTSAIGGDEFNTAFIVNKMVDINLYRRGGEQVCPLYLVESDSDSDSAHSSLRGDSTNRRSNPKQNIDCHESLRDSRNDKVALVENFTQSFRAFIDTKYGQRFAPEVILGYIYAVLFHKDYREKFLDFLKIDFPRIPFVKSKEQFLALSALGEQIIELHLMRGEIESITEPLFDKPQNRNERIEKITYNAEQKRLYVNESLYFSDVSEEVWGYKIGGYAVCEKYLKSHKGEVLDYAHFERIITTLHESLRVESQIAKIALE